MKSPNIKMTMGGKIDRGGGSESHKPTGHSANMVTVKRLSEPEPKKAATVVPAKVPSVSIKSAPDTVTPKKPPTPETIGMSNSGAGNITKNMHKLKVS